MRGVVAKRLARQAMAISKPTVAKMKWYKRLVSGKTDEKAGYDIRGTLVYTGFRRVYQDSKKKYRARCFC